MVTLQAIKLPLQNKSLFIVLCNLLAMLILNWVNATIYLVWFGHMLIAVEITLRISGFQQRVSELTGPDYLMCSAKPENMVQ